MRNVDLTIPILKCNCCRVFLKKGTLMVDDVTLLITFVQVNRTISDLVWTLQCVCPWLGDSLSLYFAVYWRQLLQHRCTGSNSA